MSGTRPPYSSRSIRAAATMSRAFDRKKPQDRTYGSTSSCVAAAKASSVGNRAKSAGVTWLTRSSVHWADSRTAKSSS